MYLPINYNKESISFNSLTNLRAYPGLNDNGATNCVRSRKKGSKSNQCAKINKKNPSSFTVNQLKETLRDLGLPQGGAKAELIN